MLYNIYCDESCHLEHDGCKVMVLGSIWTLKNNVRKFVKIIREIKQKHNIPSNFEIKWTKVSPGKIDFYLELIRFFFNNDLNYRCWIANKENLNHYFYNQTHSDWYYKMYYYMLLNILSNKDTFNIYMDIKEKKRGGIRIRELQKWLTKAKHNLYKDTIQNISVVESNNIELLQLADLINGAVAYFHNGLKTSEAKLKIIDAIRKYSNVSLIKSSLPKEQKFNIYIHTPGEDYE